MVLIFKGVIKIFRILIDADACPVIDIAISVSSLYEIKCILFCDTSHIIEKYNVETITVSQGRDSVDFAIINALRKNDIVITNDYGLAAMCLVKGAYVINHYGKELTTENIDELLFFRYESEKFRRAGGKTKGPKKRTKKNNLDFEIKFRQICERTLKMIGGR